MDLDSLDGDGFIEVIKWFVGADFLFVETYSWGRP